MSAAALQRMARASPRFAAREDSLLQVGRLGKVLQLHVALQLRPRG